MATYKVTINTDKYKCGKLNEDEVIEELRAKGKVKIPFKWLYDIRQYDNAMNGCYMEIVKM